MKLPGILVPGALAGFFLAFAIWGSLAVFGSSAPTSVLTAPGPGVEARQPRPLGPANEDQAVTVVEAERSRRPEPIGVGRAPQSSAPPVAVVIPKVEIDSSLEDLGLTDDGALEAPTDFDRAGWFTAGTLPGNQGPAVIAGHVDSTTGPAAFTRLPELVAGDEVFVDRADGTRLRFVVTRTEQVAKDAFPTDAVYGATVGPELRLVTCGGAFDRSTNHYVDNVVVYAVLA